MATPKLNLLAQRFMLQIQDPITVTAGLIGTGKLIRTRDEIHQYLNTAMLKYIDVKWNAAEGDKRVMLKVLPDIYEEKQITFPLNDNNLDLTTHSESFRDVLDVLDSFKSGSTSNTPIEVWNTDRLSDAITGEDPFYLGSAARPGIIYSAPTLYLFPLSLVQSGTYSFTLCYLRRPVNPEDGSYLVSGGEFDIPFSDKSIQEIADIATQLYRIDDYQEDVGGS